MKRLFFIIPLFFCLLFLNQPASVYAENCSVAGDPCCSIEMTQGGYDGYCNNNLTCHIIDASAWLIDPSDPDASECLDIPCGAKGQPCCDGTCNGDDLVCAQALTGEYKDICSIKEKFNKTAVTCATSEGNEGVITALGCIDVSSGSGLVTTILRFATGIGGGLALALILFGVFIVTTSAGNPDKLRQGKEIITSAIIGLIFILLSIFLVNFIGINILGLPGLT